MHSHAAVRFTVVRDAFALVLHSHLPYARGAGRWPHGEEWVHEAMLGTYLPLLMALHDMRAAGVPFRMTIGLTPPLLEQLADADIDHRFVEYADDQIARAHRDRHDLAGYGAPHRASLAGFYADLYARLREAYVGRFQRDLVGAFADLARSGHVEVLTCAATHGYLPLLDPASVDLQLDVGRRSSRRLLGFEPTGIWLPECAYRPGLEETLERHGLTHFFTDGILIAGREVGPTGRRFRSTRERQRSGAALAQLDPLAPGRGGEADVFEPYLVADSGIAAVARHSEISGKVWSAELGYPGDPHYREFHRKDERSGLRYWRVTDMRTDLGQKAEYVVHDAAERVRWHADHFVGEVRRELAEHRTRTGRTGMLTATFDSELFGHWWFEGIDWLGLVLRALSDGGDVGTTTVSAYLEASPPRERVALREGSWGKDNDHSTWLNPDTTWIWHELEPMARQFSELRRALPTDELRLRAARQAARELLLAQSSDWPFLVSTRQAADYAAERFRAHAQRFRRAMEIAAHGTASDEVELRSLERVDNPFPEVGF
jgi:1,4-alpha-glucan branching enzyme